MKNLRRIFECTYVSLGICISIILEDNPYTDLMYKISFNFEESGLQFPGASRNFPQNQFCRSFCQTFDCFKTLVYKRTRFNSYEDNKFLMSHLKKNKSWYLIFTLFIQKQNLEDLIKLQFKIF